MRVGRVLAGAALAPFVVGFAASAAVPRATVEFRFEDPAIVESSGLVARDGLFVTVNDSGDTGRVFTVDPADGGTVGVTTWSEDPVDVEAVAPAGDGEVWVADIGDNGAVRPSVSITRVPVGRGDRSVDPPTYELVYPDGPHNAETLLVEPRSGRLVVVTKEFFGGAVLLAPRRLEPDGPNRLRRVGSVLGIATDGTFLPDGRHVILRDYSSAVVYDYPGLTEVGRFRLPRQEQGEGIAANEDGDVFVSSEGVRAPVLRVRLPSAVRRALDPPAPPPSTQPTAPASTPEAGAEPQDEPARTTPDLDGPQWPWLVAGLVLLVGGVLVVVVVGGGALVGLRAVRARRRPGG